MVAQNWAWVWADAIYAPCGGASAIFDSTTKLDMRFPGQWFQLESGLAYNWRRHYDATLGRHVQPDPIELDGGRKAKYEEWRPDTKTSENVGNERKTTDNSSFVCNSAQSSGKRARDPPRRGGGLCGQSALDGELKPFNQWLGGIIGKISNLT